jgi:hypothetical protein
MATPGRPAAARVATGLWAVSVAQVCFLVLLGLMNRLTLRDFFANFTVSVLGATLSFATLGLLIVLQRRDNVIGWLFLTAGVLFGTSWTAEYSRYALVTDPGALPAGELALWFSRWSFFPMIGLVAICLPLLFPDAKLLSPRWSLVAVVGAAGVVLLSVSGAIDTQPGDASLPNLPNRFAPDWAPAFVPPLQTAGLIFTLFAVAGALASAIVR